MKNGLVMISANKAWNLYSRKRLLSALQGAGWSVIAMADPDPNAGRIEKDFGIPFIDLPMKSDGTSLKEDGRLFFRYLSLYRKHRPQVVLHINNKPNIYGSIAASVLGIPSISNITGLGVVAEKKGLTRTLVYTLYRLAFRSSKAFVFFQNGDDRRFFVGNRLVSAGKTGLLPGSGVNVEDYLPDPGFRPKEKGQAVTFLFNGRLLLTKGIGEYLRAAERVKALYPDTVFNILGEHDPANPLYIPQKVLQESVTSGSVRYLGMVADVRPSVGAADCVVLPSYYREGVPRALLEAAAMGKPLIVADSVGTREPVEAGINGFLTVPADTESLVKAMLGFIESGAAEKGQMGIESRRIAETRFNDTIIADSYVRKMAEIGVDREK